MEILCRIDPTTAQPVVFVTDSINGDKIKAWKGEGKSEYVPLDYYHMTGPLSASDERILCERFVKATAAVGMVKIRHRLPRTNRPLPNLLAKGAIPSQLPAEPIVQGSTVGDATIVTTPVAPPRPQRRAAKKAKAVKRAGRRPAARPIEAQAVSSGTQVAPSVAQATPADVMAAIQAVGEEFNGKLAALAAMLTANK